MCVQVVLNYALPDWTQPTLTCYCTSMLFATIHVVGLSILAFQQTSLTVVCVSCCNGGHIFDEGILNVNLASCMHCIGRKTFAENGINFERLCHHNVHCAFTCAPKIAPSLGGSMPPTNTWFPWPTRVFVPNRMQIGSAISLQLTIFSPYTLQWGGSYPPKLPLPSPKSITHLDLFSHFCRSHCCD